MENSGNADAFASTFQDTLETNLDFQGMGGFTLGTGDIPVGATVNISFTAQIIGPPTSGDHFENSSLF